MKSVLDLMEASEKTRTPVVGYVDSSRARDLSQMYSWLDDGSTTGLNDGVLLPESEWLQRTPAFVCARAKGLENYEAAGAADRCTFRISPFQPRRAAGAVGVPRLDFGIRTA